MAAPSDLSSTRPKKTIFSSKRNRSVVFNAKNFWTADSRVFSVKGVTRHVAAERKMMINIPVKEVMKKQLKTEPEPPPPPPPQPPSPPSPSSPSSPPTPPAPPVTSSSQPLPVTSSSQPLPVTESQPFSLTSSSQSSSVTSLSQPLPGKPKKRIFSSSKSNRSVVFNAKNFWSQNHDISELEEGSASTLGSGSSVTSSNNKNDLDFEDDYVVLRRVKKANQCHDLGETEQFDGDIKFYLSGIESSNSIPMRCLSILGLSQQTMRPEFRLHLRAHDDMPKIISALMDAPSDPNLALCTATLLFIYNQGGRLNMDINANALSLMLQLMEVRIDECNQVENRHRLKVRELCEEVKKNGHAQYLNLNEITAGKLSMETLLGLTSKRANKESLKDELRKLKGIDFILNTVFRCAENLQSEGEMIKIDRCMHVLENVTFDNIENQMYILNYNNGMFVSSFIKMLHNCKEQIILLNDSKVVLSTFFSILRVLTHLTSESVGGCKVIGSCDGIMDLLIDSLFELPSFILPDQRFDLMVILLCLCINLLEFCPEIRKIIISNIKTLKRLVELLLQRIDEAQKTEQQADELLESHESTPMNEAMRDSILTQILAKSGKHMEHSIIAACISLLLGCTIQDNYHYTCILRDHLPDSSFNQLVDVLQKFRDFAHLADIMTMKGKERVERIIQVFKTSL